MASQTQPTATPNLAESEPWQRLKAVVAEAVDLPRAARAAFLDAACAGDPELRHEAAELLELERPADGFIDASPMLRDGDVVEALSAGARLGPYRLVRPLGAGGMGEVFLAERADGAFEQRVAIKVIHARGLLGDEILRRFLAERQLLAEMSHPNIARLFDGGTSDDGRPYLVMEYVAGEPIDNYCDRHKLSVEARLWLFLDVCGAVEHAHRQLVVHRDLKPANVLVTAEGRPKLLDFGVAKDLGDRAKTPATRFLVPVTVEYASPEQLAGGVVTTATDVYALGAMLYELLTGASPFGDRDDPLAGRSREAPPRPPSRRALDAATARKLAGDLDHIVLRALAAKRAERYPSVEQLARDLEWHLEGRPLESRRGRLYRLGKHARRHWKALAAAIVTLVLAVGLISESVERRQVERESQRFSRLSRDLGDYLNDIFLEADPGRSGERNETLERLLSHGIELLRSGAFEGEPLVRAELLGTMGQVYRRLGRLAEAEPPLRECLALRRQHLPPDHEDIGLASNNLALTLRDLGFYPEARTLLWETRRILSLYHAGDHPDVATLLNNLAGVEKDLGNLDVAVELYREALEMKRRLARYFGPNAITMAVKNLGTGLRDAGRLDEAEGLFRDAIRQAARLEKKDSTLEAGIEHHLGSLLRERGDFAGAASLLHRAYDGRVDAYGEDHPKSMESLLELALLDQAERRLGIAEVRIRQVLDVRRQEFGQEHPDTAEALVALARLLVENGGGAGAVAAVEEALEILRVRLPADHWRIVEAEALADQVRGPS